MIVNYEDLEEIEVIEEDYAQNENEAVAVTEVCVSQKLTTVQEIEPTNKVRLGTLKYSTVKGGKLGALCEKMYVSQSSLHNYLLYMLAR